MHFFPFFFYSQSDDAYLHEVIIFRTTKLVDCIYLFMNGSTDIIDIRRFHVLKLI